MIRKVVPIITRSPWNPVAIEKVNLYAESVTVNGDSIYPCACSAMKYIPSSTVKNSPSVAWVALFSSRPWCAHGTVIWGKKDCCI